MQNKSFLDYDISVSADKKRRSKRSSASGGFESSVRTCEADDCSEEAKYRAPKSPKDLENFHWFCLRHVKEYNTRWNFFKNHSEEEFEKEVNLSKTWGRKTKPFGSKSSVNRAHSDGNSRLRFGIGIRTVLLIVQGATKLILQVQKKDLTIQSRKLYQYQAQHQP